MTAEPDMMIIESVIDDAEELALLIRHAIRAEIGTIRGMAFFASAALVKIMEARGSPARTRIGDAAWKLLPLAGRSPLGYAYYRYSENDGSWHAWTEVRATDEDFEIVDLVCDGIVELEDFPKGEFQPPMPIWTPRLPPTHAYHPHGAGFVVHEQCWKLVQPKVERVVARVEASLQRGR